MRRGAGCLPSARRRRRDRLMLRAIFFEGLGEKGARGESSRRTGRMAQPQPRRVQMQMFPFRQPENTVRNRYAQLRSGIIVPVEHHALGDVVGYVAQAINHVIESIQTEQQNMQYQKMYQDMKLLLLTGPAFQLTNITEQKPIFQISLSTSSATSFPSAGHAIVFTQYATARLCQLIGDYAGARYYASDADRSSSLQAVNASLAGQAGSFRSNIETCARDLNQALTVLTSNTNTTSATETISAILNRVLHNATIRESTRTKPAVVASVSNEEVTLGLPGEFEDHLNSLLGQIPSTEAQRDRQQKNLALILNDVRAHLDFAGIPPAIVEYAATGFKFYIAAALHNRPGTELVHVPPLLISSRTPLNSLVEQELVLYALCLHHCRRTLSSLKEWTTRQAAATTAAPARAPGAATASGAFPRGAR